MLCTSTLHLLWTAKLRLPQTIQPLHLADCEDVCCWKRVNYCSEANSGRTGYLIRIDNATIWKFKKEGDILDHVHCGCLAIDYSILFVTILCDQHSHPFEKIHWRHIGIALYSNEGSLVFESFVSCSLVDLCRSLPLRM